MGYFYQYHDGDEWITVEEFIFDDPTAAKSAGISDGFEYVRVIRAPSKEDK